MTTEQLTRDLVQVHVEWRRAPHGTPRRRAQERSKAREREEFLRHREEFLRAIAARG